MAIGHHVMPAAGAAVQQLKQIVALAVDAGLGIHSVIGYGDEHSLGGERAGFDGGPDTADQGVDALERQELGGKIGSGVGHVIEIAGEVIEVLDAGVGEFRDELALGLIFHGAADFKADGPLVKQVAQGAREAVRKRVSQSLPAYAALVELKALIRGGVWKIVDQQRDSE